MFPLSEGACQLLASWDSIMHSPYVFPSQKNPLKPRNARSFSAGPLTRRFDGLAF